MNKLPQDLEHWLRWVEHEKPDPIRAAGRAYEQMGDACWKPLDEAAGIISDRNLGDKAPYVLCCDYEECENVAWALAEFPSALIALTRALYAPYAEMCEVVPECVETEIPQTGKGGFFGDIDLTKCIDPTIPPGHVRIDGQIVPIDYDITFTNSTDIRLR